MTHSYLCFSKTQAIYKVPNHERLSTIHTNAGTVIPALYKYYMVIADLSEEELLYVKLLSINTFSLSEKTARIRPGLSLYDFSIIELDRYTTEEIFYNMKHIWK